MKYSVCVCGITERSPTNQMVVGPISNVLELLCVIVNHSRLEAKGHCQNKNPSNKLPLFSIEQHQLST